MRRAAIVFLMVVFIGACSNEPLTETTLSGTDGQVSSEPESAADSSAQPDESIPDQLASISTPTWLSFSIEDEYEVDGLRVARGMITRDGELLFLSPASYPHHQLSLFLGDEAWNISASQWGLFWDVPEDGSSATDATYLRAIFEPLFEEGPFSGEREIVLGADKLSLTYDAAPVAQGSQPSGTITFEERAITVIFEADDALAVMPDPRLEDFDALFLGPEDVTGENANPVVAAWFDAYQQQKQRN